MWQVSQLSHECNTSRVKMPKHIKKSTVWSNDRLPALDLSRGDYHYVNAAIGGGTKNRYLSIPLAHSSTTIVYVGPKYLPSKSKDPCS